MTLSTETLVAIARGLVILTPLAILLFLTCFLVWIGQGRYDNRFTRFCEQAMVPSGLGAVVMILVSLRYF